MSLNMNMSFAGIIYCVDSSDRHRLDEAREELFGIITDEGMPKGVPVVVIANKQDLPSKASLIYQ